MRQTVSRSFGVCLGLVLMLFVVLYGLLNMSAAAQGGPPLPHKFYGAVEIDGQPAPVGTVVQAGGADVYINPDLGNPITTTEVGKYGAPGVFEAKLVVQGEPDGSLGNGDPIEFYINGMRAKCYYSETQEWSDTFPFQSEALTELDLFFIGQYTLIVTSAGCCPISVTYDTTTATITAGAIGTFTPITGGLTVTLEATSDDSCRFDGWGGDVVTTANPIVIPMRSDVAVTATCTILTEHTLTVHETGSGTVDIDPDQEIYIYDTVVTLTAVPSQTWTFGGWSGDVPAELSAINPVTITIDGDKEITATFNFYSVTVSPETDEKPGTAGEPVVYVLEVINTGGVMDTFTVTAASSNAWTVTAPSDVGPLVAAGDELVAVRVQIPPDTLSGTVDVITFTVTSQGDPRKSATALLTTTVTKGYVHTIFMPLVMKNATGFGSGF